MNVNDPKIYEGLTDEQAQLLKEILTLIYRLVDQIKSAKLFSININAFENYQIPILMEPHKQKIWVRRLKILFNKALKDPVLRDFAIIQKLERQIKSF